MKLFFDTNVILDILVKREPHYISSANLLSEVVVGKHKGFASVLTYSNIYYVLEKTTGEAQALKSMRKISSFIEMLGVTAEMGNKALTAGMPDYEDALQYLCAKKNDMDVIVTRNKGDFSKASIRAFTPEEVLAK